MLVDKKLIVPALMGVLLLATFSTGCTGKGEALETASAGDDGEAATELKSDPKKDRVPVEIATLETGSIESVLRFSTTLEAETEVRVFSEASRQILELKVEEGDYVKKGQLLLRLEDDAQRSALAKAESQLAKAEREYQRQKRVYEEQLISEQAYSEATYEVEQLQIAVEDAKRELSYTEVRAPIAGVITQRLVDRGDTVTVNQHLFDLVDFDTIVARVFVPEKELPRLRVGLDARIDAESLDSARGGGRIIRIAPVVDAQSGTIKTTVAVPKNLGLRPGTFVEVELVTAVNTDALLIPKRSIVYDNDQAFVFRLVDAEDDMGQPVLEAERVLITPRLEDRDFVEPEAGALAPGDRVVTAGQAGLKNGAPVRLLDGAPAVPAAAGDSPADAAEEAA